ncbi:MAG TPA: type II secretion system F family protein [Azospirillum sp.]|nr:type II secretion system F family protein [Azospirillum sp.]
MATFRYKAVSASGQTVEGTLEAGDKATAFRRLSEMGYLPIRADPAKGGLRFDIDLTALRRGVSRSELVATTRQLATLVDARVPLDRALEMMAARGASRAMRTVLSDVLDRLRGGATLTDALASHPGAFPSFYVNMVRAGEAGGALEAVLARMADHMERAAAMRETLRSALIYPIVLLVMVCATIVVMLTVVLPQFQGMFEEAGARLPAAAVAVIRAGELFRAWWWTLPLACVASIVWLRAALSQPAQRLRLHARVLRLPIVGDIVTKAETARFTRALATLTGNGVPMLQALSIVRDTVANAVLRRALDEVTASVRKGQGLAEPLERIGSLPPLAVQLVAVGEETGQLVPMLAKVADVFDREVQVAVGRMVDLLTPALTIGLGLIVATIVGAILSAILSVYSLPV